MKLFCISKMQDSVADLLCAPLIPVLSADVAAGASCDVHLILVTVVALGTFPYQFAVVFDYLYLTVIAADLTVIALGIQFCIHYIIVYEPDDIQHSGDILLHIGNFNIAYSAARRQMLELALKFQLGESIYLFSNMYVVAVCNITLVCYTFYYAETLLQTSCELVRGRFQRSAVDREVDVLFFLPLLAGIVHVLHYLQCERFCFGVCVAFARHVFHTFVKTCIAQRDSRIAAVEEFIYRLALFKPCQSIGAASESVPFSLSCLHISAL